jgi:hypothetical protein
LAGGGGSEIYGYWFNGSGNQTVNYTVPVNYTGITRTNLIWVTMPGRPTESFKIVQTPCSYTISPANISVAAGGTNGTLTVTTEGECMWLAGVESAAASWLSADSSTHSGSSTIAWAVSANNTGGRRSGTIWVMDQAFRIAQVRKGPYSALHFFGVGVDWSLAGSCLRGDLDANNLKDALSRNLPNFSSGEVVTLDASASGAANEATISTRFAQFVQNVGPNDTVVFFVASHGDKRPGMYNYAVLPIADDAISSLSATSIAAYLLSPPPTVRVIFILDTCHAGGIAAELMRLLPNAQAFAASTADGTTSSDPNGCTGLFTDFINSQLNGGVFDLSEILSAVTPGTYNQYQGLELPLRDRGTAVFTGLEPELYERAGFRGDLLGSVISAVQPSPVTSAIAVTNGLCQVFWSGVPASGSVVIQRSSDLTTWQQVGFQPAAGTNVSYSIPATNQPEMFFRAKLIP